MTTSYQDDNFILQYSPRTSYSMCLDEEEQLYKELKLNFDPITIKIIKKHFKEQLGMLSKENFIAILKNHLLSFQPTHPHREKLLIHLLSRLFSDIDLNDNGKLTWNEFTDYIIHFTNTKDKNINNKDYRLKFYSPSLNCIKHNELTEMISYAFFIEKYNVIGIVQECKSTILFFDVKKYTKIKCSIDIKDVQGMVDVIQFGELSKKAERILAKEEESKKIHRSKLYGLHKGERKKSVVNVIKDRDNSSLSCSDDDDDNNTPPIIKRRASHSTSSTSVKADQTFKSNANRKLGIICTVFIPEYDILLIAGTNNTITAWYFNGGEVKNVNTINDFILTKDEIRIAVLTTDSPQYSMIWDSQLKHLYTGQKDGRILKWDLTKPTHLIDDVFDIKIIHTHNNNNNNNNVCASSSYNTLKEQLRKHSTRHQSQSESSFVYVNDKDKNESVSCLLLLTKLQLLAASYYSGYIILWDTLLRDYRKCYCDQSTGVYAMAFDSFKNLLFTCGFDHNIYVYDPYIDGNAIYKLSGHSWSLNSIDVNEKESELISLDILGNIKIWDTQAFISFQNIKLNEECNNNINASVKKTNNECSTKNRKLTSNIKMLYIKKYKKIFIYGTKLISFETNRTNYPELADDQVICACYYDKVTKTLLSFCLKKIKMWNILTGKVKQIYDDIMGNEITAVTVDKNVKRGFIGDNTGKIKNINLRTGNAIKDLTPHTTEIKFICHSTCLNIVVSVSIDNVIKIHNDKELLETDVIKELNVNQFQIRAICIVERFCRLAIGLSNGVVKFYDIEHFHYDSDLTNENAYIKDEVSALSNVNGVELVLCCYCKGLCKLMVTPPSTAKFAVLYEFTNTTTANAFTVAVVSIEFDEEGGRLFIGDALGYITCIDVSQLYKVINTIMLNEKRKFELETIITKENLHLFSQLVLPKLWYIEAHKEAIKHLHYINIEPQIIISTSHDLRIKAFAVSNGEYKDEFKQNANNYKSIPIGIKYYLLDPFGNNNNNDDVNKPPQPYYYSRKDINGFTMNLNNENEYQQITEYSKKITEYNAKEKLYLNSRNVNCPFNMSNNWLLDINVDKVLTKEENEFKKLVDIVTKTERITKVTEYILQHKSIYCESYKPKYIEEMNDFETIKKYSRLISERLRHVKMAVSKANLNQCKMKDLKSSNNNNNKQRNKRKIIPKSKSALNLSAVNDNNNIFKRNIRKGTELSNVNVAVRNDGRNVTNCSYSSYNVNLNVQTTNKTNYVNTKSKLINGNRNIRQRKHRISTMLNHSNVAEHFYRFKEDFDNGFKQMIVPFKMLIKKSKNKNKKNLLLPNIHSTNNGEVNEHEKVMAHKQEERRKRFASMEYELQKIEQDYYY